MNIKPGMEEIYEVWNKGRSCSNLTKELVEKLGEFLDRGLSIEDAVKDVNFLVQKNNVGFHCLFCATTVSNIDYILEVIGQFHPRGKEVVEWRRK